VSPDVQAALGVDRSDDEDAVVGGLAGRIEALSDDDLRRRLAEDARSWARTTGLWTTMDRFLDVTAQAVKAAAG
jgi:hypothetical protein